MSDRPLIAYPARTHTQDRSGWLPTVAVGAVMFGWLFMLLVLSALVPNVNELPVGLPVSVGRGVSIMPAAGWSRGSDDGIADAPGVEGIMIQKGGVQGFFIVEPYEGSTEGLHEETLRGLGEDLDMFESLAPTSVAMGAGGEGVRSAFRGWTRDSLLEGLLASLSYRGSGVSCIAVGTAGSVAGVLSDVEFMLQFMEFPQ